MIDAIRTRLIAAGLPISDARQAAATNAAWLIGERLISGLLGLTVTAAVARHLGPAEFGTLSFALSLVLLFGTFWTLGLSGLVVRELVKDPARQDDLLGTLTGLRVVGGVIAFGLAILLTIILGRDDETRLAVAILLVGVLGLYAFDGIDFWLQAQVRSRHAVIARSAALLVASAFNIVLIVVGAPLLAFVVAAAVEFALGGVFLLATYVRQGGHPRRWRYHGPLARQLLLASWPLILSGVFNAINLRVDQLMLGTMVGREAVGTYAAAARLSEVWYFVPTAIAASVFPAMVRAHTGDRRAFDSWMGRLYDLLVALALPIAIVVALLAGPLIELIYGPAYAESAPILAVHVWAGPFVFMGAALSRWLIAEDRLKFSLVRHGAGATVNIVLNLILIPEFGGLGAAWATLISYAVASVGACFLYRPLWGQGRQMVLALLLPVRLVAAGLRRLAPTRA
ncbi:MAG TPA: flippase [Candidatus Saccharimonadales bacterium]|nr:flippase [Candidatus Saccharimonadales bacterium]